MNSDKWNRIEVLCHEAMGLQGGDRDTYLLNSCEGDEELITEVKSLLEELESELPLQPFVQVQSSFVFSDEDSSADKIIGPYRLIRTIASGGMGQVYLAVRDDDQFERFVALKVIRKGLVSDDVLARFYEERQILASLNHPNIARMFDGGTSREGTPWFAMEFIEGVPITKYCERHGLSIGERIDLFLKVCSAVQYAHQNLVIHRDLKPANILITREGIPKLLDFGISKLTSIEQKSGQTQYQHRMMTPEYASPEQVQGDPISTVSDVYSLGVLLYELLAGSLPYEFRKRTPAAIEQTICTTIPGRPSAVSNKKGLKGDLDSVILKALRKEPSERYASVEQLANDLLRHKKALPVLAQKDSLGYRGRKFLQRHRWSVAVTAAIALLVVAFAVVTYIQSKAIEARAQEAEQISNFLTELFESVDPSEAKDRSLSAIELLHRGADRVETELGDQPHLQSRLYLVISDVYEKLGLFDDGIDMAQKALLLQRNLHGRKNADIATSLNALGWLSYQKGDYKTADSLLQTALAMRRELFGDVHLDISRTLNDLAVLNQTQGNYTVADTLLKSALDIRKKKLGDVHESIGVTLGNYATLKYLLGDLPAAEERMREALHVFQTVFGNEHMRVALTMTNLGTILVVRKKFTEAEKVYREALNIRLQLLGDEHPDVADSYAHLGNLLRRNGATHEAEKLMLKALNLHKKLLGEHHKKVGSDFRVLANLYREEGDYISAETNYKAALEIYRKAYPEGHFHTASVLHFLGEVYMAMNEPERAEQPFREAMVFRKQMYGENDIRTAKSMIRLGTCLFNLGDLVEAKPLFISGLEILNRSDGNFNELKKEAESALATL